VGENPANAVPGSLLLVHFWEPWNVLSRQSVFLLSRLQREFPQQIRVLHVTAGDAQTVTEFLDERTPPLGRSHRDSVAGTFATDPDRRLALAWKLPKSTVALPTVYLANAEGILQWSGPGLRIERPLRAVLEGTWNLESAAVATNALKELEWRILQNTTRGVPSKARQLLQETPEDPEVAMILLDLLLAEEKYGELEEVAARALEICGNNVDALNRLAWMIVAASESPRVPLQTALRAASKAVMLSGRRPETLETLARVHFRRRSIREAIEIQQEAIAGAATERRALQEAILREYQQAGR
jgi:tetratricopeptide (TPR) repeat protein